MAKVLSLLLTVVLVLLLIGALLYMMGNPLRIVGPFKIVGGNPGNYSDGQYVWGLKKPFLMRYVHRGDVVIYNEPFEDDQGKRYEPNDSMGMHIGEVVGMPGNKVNETTYDFFNSKIEGSVPEGYYLISKNRSQTWRLLPQTAVTDVIVYP